MPVKNLNMILIILSLVFCAFSKDNNTSKKTDMVSSASQQTEELKDDVKENDTLVLTARLIEIPGTMPPNDLYDYVFIMKYRVLAVTKGKCSEKEIYVGHYNPLIPRSQIKGKMDPLVNGNIEKFTAGSKHQLTLVSPIEKVWKDAVEDNYIEIEQPRHFALVADELK